MEHCNNYKELRNFISLAIDKKMRVFLTPLISTIDWGMTTTSTVQNKDGIVVGNVFSDHENLSLYFSLSALIYTPIQDGGQLYNLKDVSISLYSYD